MSLVKQIIKTELAKVVVYKDNFSGRRFSWHADLHWKNGRVWRGWQYGYSTKANVLAAVRAFVHNDIPIETR